MTEILPTEAPSTVRDILAYLDHSASNRLVPFSGRLNFETAIPLKLFHRLEKASRKWYHSELNPQKFAMIVVRALEGSGRTP